MNHTDWKLLKEIAELEKTPQGAYNIRRNGQLDSRASTANIEITTKTDPERVGPHPGHHYPDRYVRDGI